MLRPKIKFYINTSMLAMVEDEFFRDPNEPLNEWLRSNYGLIPAGQLPSSIPRREGGHYYLRCSKGLYHVWVYLKDQWWKYEKQLCGYSLKPEYSLSDKEFRTLVTMVRMGRKKWLTREALQMVYDYQHQKEMRWITREAGKGWPAFLRENGLA